MVNDVLRIGVVGASSLAGREVADVLVESSLTEAMLILLDDDEAAGQMTAAGDEAAVIQKLDESSFEGMDFAFFTGSVAVTRTQWQGARKAGASIVDLTHALEHEPGVLVRAPWVDEALGRAATLDLGTQAVVAAHPATVMLGLVAARLSAKFTVTGLAATVLAPVSEHGQAAMDELHQQTVNLLSFQSLPREQYDAQIAFNLLPALGEGAKIGAGLERVRTQYEKVSAGRLPELTMQLVYAPVFHGYTVSALIDLAGPVTVEEIERALAGPHLDLVAEGSDPPSNLSAAGQDDVLAQVRAGFAGERGRRFWMWLAADNLKLSALNAVACALELRRLRPKGTVQ